MATVNEQFSIGFLGRVKIALHVAWIMAKCTYGYVTQETFTRGNRIKLTYMLTFLKPGEGGTGARFSVGTTAGGKQECAEKGLAS